MNDYFSSPGETLDAAGRWIKPPTHFVPARSSCIKKNMLNKKHAASASKSIACVVRSKTLIKTPDHSVSFASIKFAKKQTCDD